MKIRMLVPFRTRLFNTEKSYELHLQKEYESDFVPRLGDQIECNFNSIEYKNVVEVKVMPLRSEVELILSGNNTPATNLEELNEEVQKVAINGWSIKI